MSILNELRIGNIIECKPYGICKIIGFYKDSAWVIGDYGEEYKVSVNDLRSVKLKLNWLETFGFECTERKVIPLDIYDCDEEIWSFYVCSDLHAAHYYFNIKLRQHMGYIDTQEWYIEENGENPIFLLLQSDYSVHDLQNAFFQAFGKELKINNPNILKDK